MITNGTRSVEACYIQSCKNFFLLLFFFFSSVKFRRFSQILFFQNFSDIFFPQNFFGRFFFSKFFRPIFFFFQKILGRFFPQNAPVLTFSDSAFSAFGLAPWKNRYVQSYEYFGNICASLWNHPHRIAEKQRFAPASYKHSYKISGNFRFAPAS